MKRILKIVVLVVVVLIVVIAVPLASALFGRRSADDGVEVNGVRIVKDVLFVGDSADVGRGGEVQGAPWVFSDSQDENRQSLVRLNDRLAHDGASVKAIAFAHSGVLSEGLGPLTAFAQNNQ